MSARTFFTADAKARVAGASAVIEKHTSAEVVVSVRDVSGHYRDTDYLFGFLVATAVLCMFLFHPAEFSNDLFPVESVVSFALGAAACANLPPLRRLLTSRRRMARDVATAAGAAFAELGIDHTHRRRGILVFVSMFERRVAVVVDAGVDEAALGVPWREGLARLEQAVAQRTHVDRFIDALSALGPILKAALPRGEGDENELPDEVRR
jgi:putative membrane protein